VRMVLIRTVIEIGVLGDICFFFWWDKSFGLGVDRGTLVFLSMMGAAMRILICIFRY
jgi:hypothetical protein